MADYGFEVKNDDGDYLVSDKTTSLTFVKRVPVEKSNQKD